MKQRLKFWKPVVWIALVAALSFPFAKKISEVVKKDRTCICADDGYGYYHYLPQLFGTGSLRTNIDDLEKRYIPYCNESKLYQFHLAENGEWVNIYQIGLSLVQAPSFLIAHGFAFLFGYLADGFSAPYQISYLLNALFLILLGLRVFYLLLRLYFPHVLSMGLLFALVFGSNFYITATHQYDLPHVYLFGLTATFLYFLLRETDSHRKRDIIISALALGLAVAIRPTSIVLGLIPAIHIYKVYPNLKTWLKVMLLFLLVGFLFQVPQLLYWKVIGGHWFMPNMHIEEIDLGRPNFSNFLFSFRKGWLIYSPIFFLLLIGFWKCYKHQRALFWGGILSSSLFIWIVCSWETWWYAASFGARPMVDLYPILILILGFGLHHSRHTLLYSQVGYVSLCTVFSILQSIQFNRGTLPSDRMTMAHYGYIFGKLNIEDYNDARLLIDTPEDLQEKAKVLNSEIITETLNTKRRFTSNKTEYILLADIPMHKWMNKDIVVEVSFKSNKPEGSYLDVRAELQRNNVSYSWFTHLVPAEASATDSSLRFVLPTPFHESDVLKVVAYNRDGQNLEIKDLSIRFLSINGD